MKPNLKNRRISLNLTLEEVGNYVGVAKSTVRKWETGAIENMGRDKIVKLAEILKVSPSYIMGWEEETLHPIRVDVVPILAGVSAGEPMYAEENVIDYAYLPETMLSDDKELFALRVDGDSMNKEFNDGDIVLVEKDAPIENGQIGVVMVNGYNATVKRIQYAGDSIILSPESSNPIHQPQVYTKGDEVICVGRVISAQRFY